jgi:hypothetical protein
MGYQPEPHGGRTFSFFRIAIMAAILLRGPSTIAQTPKIAVSNGTASLSWPLTAYYYLLQSSTNLSGSNAWFNVATASTESSIFSFIIPGDSTWVAEAPIISNVVGDNFVITQATTNAHQFFRLQAPFILPVCSFAIFYEGMLEFTKTADMHVDGTVYANGPVCVGTSATLVFNDSVTTTKTMSGPERDGWTPSPWNQGTTFNGHPSFVTNISAFLPPFGTNDPHVLIDIPPANEDPNSSLGQSRLYNQAHVLIIVTNQPSVSGTNIPWVTLILQNSVNLMIPGADPNKGKYTYIYTNNVFTNFTVAPSLQPNGIEYFLSVTNKFTDIREYQSNMFVAQINVGAYAAWVVTNRFCAGKFSSVSPPTILYVADRRNIGTNKLSVVRLVNGNQLPNNSGLGFTVGTQNPLYVKGNYNITADGVHFAYLPRSTTNNGSCVPAALMCDAITILSSSFNDATSPNSRPAAAAPSNTVNAAIITGNVPSTDVTTTTFSGGVQNLIRLQEDWDGGSKYVILNTSLVRLFSSQMATNQFRNPVGWSPAPISPYYTAPTRLWGLDPNFYNIYKQPPGIPIYTLPEYFLHLSL